MAKTKSAPLRELRRALLVGATKRGDVLVVDVDGAQVVKAGTSDVVAKLEGVELSCAGLDPAGTLLAVVTWKQVTLYSVPDFKALWSVPSQVFEARALCFVDDSVWHLARTGSERLSLKNGKQLEKAGAGARLLRVSRDGQRWLGYGKAPGMLSVGAAQARKRFEFPAQTATFLPDGSVVAAEGSRDGALALSLVDSGTGAVLKRASGPAVGFAEHLTASPSGRLATLRGDGGIVVIDTSSLEVTRFVKLRTAQLANVSPDDKTLFVAATDFTAHAL